MMTIPHVRRRRWPLTLALLTMALNGCASYRAWSPYLNFAGGYHDQAGPGRLRTVYYASGYILRDPAVLDSYLLYHCAELAWHHHKRYFSVYAGVPEALRDQPATAPWPREALAGQGNLKVHVLFHDQPQPGALSTRDTLRALQQEVFK